VCVCVCIIIIIIIIIQHESKNWTFLHLSITFANSVKYWPLLKFFHCCRQKLSAQKHIIEFPTSPIVYCYTTLKNANAYTSSQKLLNKSAMHARCGNFIVVTKQEIMVIFLTTSSLLLHDVIMTSYCCQRYAVSGNNFVFQQDSAPTHRAAHVQQLNCCVKKRQTFLHPTCGLQTAQISVLWITRSGLSCSIVSTTDKSIVWMN